MSEGASPAVVVGEGSGWRASLNSPSVSLFVGVALTALVLWESLPAPWAPFFPSYAALAIAVPLIAGGARFGSIRTVLTRHWRLLLLIWLLLEAVDLGIVTFGWEALLERQGLGSEAYYSIKAMLEALGEGASHRHGISKDTAMGLFALFVVVWAPFGEELFYRGYLAQNLAARHGPWLAAIVSSVLFGLRHMTHGFFLWPEVPLVACIAWGCGACLIGAVLAVVYLRTRSMWAPVVLHLGLNVVGIVLLA